MRCRSCNTVMSWNAVTSYKVDGSEEDLCWSCYSVAMQATEDELHLYFEREYQHSHLTDMVEFNNISHD